MQFYNSDETAIKESVFFPEKMPLIILTGLPSSGKSAAAEKVRNVLADKGKDSVIIREGITCLLLFFGLRRGLKVSGVDIL